MPRTLILGLGNPLRSDDAVAWHVIDALQDLVRDPNVSLKSVRQLAPELAEEVSQSEMVIFVDAAEATPQGRVSVNPVDETAPPHARFSHSLTPASLISLARTLYGKAPAKAFLVTIAAASFDISEQLSEPAAQAVPAAALAIRHLISS
jgi:hydrogenase maturation protease